MPNKRPGLNFFRGSLWIRDNSNSRSRELPVPSPSFSSNDLTEILARAQEIAAERGESLLHSPEVSELLDAAEEAGLDRESTMMALRERLTQPPAEYEEGDLVFAESTDGHSYPAVLTSPVGRLVEVRFLNGTTVKLPVANIQPFALTPGRKLQFNNQTFGYWTDGEVVRYNEDGRSVTLTYWGKDNTVSLEQVRHKKEKPMFTFTDSVKARVITLVISASAISGTIGFLIGFFAGR